MYVRQFNDGEPAGPEQVIQPHYDGQTAVELLAAKEASAHRNGWTVERDGTRMHAWKEYEPGLWVGRKDRYFEIREE